MDVSNASPDRGVTRESLMYAQRSVLTTIFLMGILIVPGTGTAARQSVADKLDHVLSGIDAAELSTDILYDRVLPLSNIELHDGQASSPIVTLAGWRQMFDEIHRAHLVNPGWPSRLELRQLAAERVGQGKIPIALLNMTYERIGPDALQDGGIK